MLLGLLRRQPNSFTPNLIDWSLKPFMLTFDHKGFSHAGNVVNA